MSFSLRHIISYVIRNQVIIKCSTKEDAPKVDVPWGYNFGIDPNGQRMYLTVRENKLTH